jgi:hypothetical protein
MAWTLTNALTAANKKLIDAPTQGAASVRTVIVEGNLPTRTGVYAGGRFRKNSTTGVRETRDATLELNEVSEVYSPGIDATAAGREGHFDENGEPYLLVSDVAKTIMAVEVLQIPASLPDTVTLSLSYKDVNPAGTSEFAVATCSFVVTAADTLGEINTKALEALMGITDNYGDLLVSSWADHREASASGGAEADAQFSAWSEDPTISGYETLLIHALTHRQDFASIAVQQSSQNQEFAATTISLEAEVKSLRANKIRDVRYGVATAMRNGDIASGVYRKDVDVQGVMLRSAQGAEQTYEQSTAQSEGGPTDLATVRFNPEAVAYGVHRSAMVQVDWDLFTTASAIFNEEQHLITAQIPWPLDAYYVEGSAILVDAFLQIETPFHDEDANGGDINLQMDIGTYTADLFAGGDGGAPLMSTEASVRGFYGSVLRSVPVASSPESTRHGINVIPTGPEWASCSRMLGETPYSSLASMWLWWDQSADMAADMETAGMVPSMGPYSQDVIIQGYEIQYQNVTGQVLQTTGAGNTLFSARIKVLAPGLANIPANYTTIESLVPTTSAVYQWVNDGKIYLDATQGGQPGTNFSNKNLGFRLPAGWRMAISLDFPQATGKVPVHSHFKCTVNLHRHAYKGEALLTNPQTLLITPYSDPTGYLFATLSRTYTQELDDTVAAPPTTTLKAALNSFQLGRAWLHLHFWQHDEKAARAPYTGSGDFR